jgi:hypothetical protein
MGSETGNEKSSRSNRELGMSPMESQARYGSIAGGGLQADKVSRAVDVMNQIRQSQGDDSRFTAQDLLRDKTATEMRYGRMADTDKFFDKTDQAGRALEAGANINVGPDGIPRIQYGNIGMKNDQGATILSTMLPSMTATAPTLGQLGGDIMRGLTGGTAFSRAAGLPNPEDAQGIMGVLSKASPMMNILGFDFSPPTGPSTAQMAQDYVGGQGMFAPDRSLTPTTPSREELLSRVGIESIPDATDSPAFRDLTPQDILDQPLESIDDIVKTFQQSLLIDELAKDAPLEENLMLTGGPAYQRAIDLYRKYPEIYNQIVNQQL